jgi:hypothetical protein
MTHKEAKQIAALLNDRNQLARTYTAADVLAEKEHYVYELREGEVVACVEHRQVQWYQLEVRHLSVASALPTQDRRPRRCLPQHGPVHSSLVSWAT